MERDYNHGDVLEFEIRNAELIGAKCPVITELHAQSAVTPAHSLFWRVKVFGPIPSDGIKGRQVLLSKEGAIVCSRELCVRSSDEYGSLTSPIPIPPGEYRLRLLFDKINGLQGPAAECPVDVFSFSSQTEAERVR